MMNHTHFIGIVGGVGPFAGLDLQYKIAQETAVGRDQDHLPVLSISYPGPIPDRTSYLLGETAVNPAYPLAAQVRFLADMGATVVGIPCNTAHAPAIWEVLRRQLAGCPVDLRHMIAEVGRFLQAQFPQVRRVGVLSTTGTYRAQIYPLTLRPLGLTVCVPTLAMQEGLVHTAVYHPQYGLKATGTVTPPAREALLTAAHALQQQGAEAIILGCTEIPLALTEPSWAGTPFIDATRVLAQALIREFRAAPRDQQEPCPVSAT